MSAHTWASRAAVALVFSLALLQLWWSGLSSGGAALGTATVLFPFSLVGAALLARINCFETRLVLALACLAQLVVTTLSLTIGLPGSPRHDVDLAAVEALVLPAAAFAMLALDRQARRSRSRAAQPPAPYAR